MSGRTSTGEGLSDGIVRQTLRMDEDFVRAFPGTTAELELAKSHPEIKARTYVLWKTLAKEQELRKPLIERGPKWTVQIGTFADTAALIAAIKAKGFNISDWARDLLGKIELAKEPTTVEVYEITPGDVGFTDYVRRDRFYEEVAKFGFVPLPPEVGPQALFQFGDELELNVWRIVGSEPIVYSDGGLYLFGVGRRGGGVWLDDGYGDPDDEWRPAYRFLFRRK